MVPPQLSLSSLIRRLVACLEAKRIEVEALYLFGSHARGEATPASDIDILLGPLPLPGNRSGRAVPALGRR